MTAADPGADTTTQLAALLRPLGEPWPAAPSPETVAAALLPVVDQLRRDAYGQGRDDEAEGAEIPEWAR